MTKSMKKLRCGIRTMEQLKTAAAHWAEIIKVNPKQIRVQEMTQKWASCSPKGWVSFSTALLDQPKAFQDYVIVHELLHLKIPNHGKLFKSLMTAYLPGWEKISAEANGKLS